MCIVTVIRRVVKVTPFSFFFIGKKASYWKKVFARLTSVLFLCLIQNIKAGFHESCLENNYSGTLPIV